MNISVNRKRSLLVTLIVLAVFNVFAFVLPFIRHEGFWVGYGFGLLAILVTASALLFVLKDGGAKSRFYRLPTIWVAWVYLAAQGLISFIEMVLPGNFYRYGIVVNVILLALCLLGLVGADVGREEIERVDEKVKTKVTAIRFLQDSLEALVVKAADPSLKKVIKELAEMVRYSDPMSSAQLEGLEGKIEDTVSVLADHILDPETALSLCDELRQMIAERNRKCKALK